MSMRRSTSTTNGITEPGHPIVGVLPLFPLLLPPQSMFPSSASRNTAPDYNPLSQLDEFSDDDDEYDRSAAAPPTPQSLLQQQDAGLELIEQHVEQLGRLSMQIHEELQGQNELLEEMDSDLEQATVQLDAVTRATQEFIRLSGGTKNCLVIASLTGIVIVLLLLILYT
jgi:hypothetical protein